MMPSSAEALWPALTAPLKRVPAVEEPMVGPALVRGDVGGVHRLVVDGRRPLHHALHEVIEVAGQVAGEEPLRGRHELDGCRRGPLLGRTWPSRFRVLRRTGWRGTRFRMRPARHRLAARPASAAFLFWRPVGPWRSVAVRLLRPQAKRLRYRPPMGVGWVPIPRTTLRVRPTNAVSSGFDARRFLGICPPVRV